MNQAPLLIGFEVWSCIIKEVGNSNGKWFELGAYFDLTWSV